MPIGVVFWVIMLLVILGKIAEYRGYGGPYILLANEWVIIVLLFLIGWRIFGFIVQG